MVCEREFLCRWGGRFDNFNLPFVPAYAKTKAKKMKLDLPKEDHRSCPLAHEYDPDIHDAIAQMRILDGSKPVHSKHGPPVKFFSPKGEPKYWVKSNAGVFGFFFYYMLDEVICPCLVNMFEMDIFHPKTEADVDELLAATVDV
jgi:hypothetical protein